MTVNVRVSRIRENLENMRLATGKPLIFMCKANAYGHGAAEIVRRVRAVGYGVATEREGAELRAYTDAPIYVTVPRIREIPLAARFGLIPLVGDVEYGKALVSRRELSACHIKVNSGMNRLGFSSPNECAALATALLDAGVRVEGVCTHYKDASEENILSQNACFDECVRAVRAVTASRGQERLPVTHVTYSGAKFAARYDMLRVGLAAYGYGEASLRPAMEVTSEIVKAKRLDRGDTLGYNGLYRADRPLAAYTVLGGYADGVDRREVGRIVLAGGGACRIAAVCMDSFEMVSDNLDLKVGDRVIILSDEISAEYVARVRGTIPYEVLVGYDTPRAERTYDE